MAQCTRLPSGADRQHQHPVASHRDRGFTFLELIVVVAIIGILVAIAVPNYSAYIAREMQRDQMSALSRAINLARTEAVKRGRNVVVCRSTAPQASSPTCNAHAGDWSTGWIVFADDNNNGGIDSTETVIIVQPGWSNSGQISANGAPLVFRPSGIGVGLAQNFTFQPNVNGVIANRTLTLNASGRWQ